MKYLTQSKEALMLAVAWPYRSIFKLLQWRLLPMIFVCVIGITISVNNIYKVSPIMRILRPTKRFSLKRIKDIPLPLVKSPKEVNIPKVEEIFKYYSFEYTSLGFGLKDLEALEQQPRYEAEKLLLEVVPKHLRERAKDYIRPVLLLSEKHQVDPLWVLSIMWTESHFKFRAKSHVGATGLMQLMPGTKKFIYRSYKRAGNNLAVENSDFKLSQYFNKVEKGQYKTQIKKLVNIEIGVIYLKKLLKQFNYNHKYATVAYNMGPGWTAKRLRKKLPVGKKNEYLEKVTKAYLHFLAQISST